MASGRKWSTLSPSYKRRLQRAGVTAREYNAGKVPSSKRKKARGHSKEQTSASTLDRRAVRESKSLSEKSPAALRRALEKIAKRNGQVDYAEILELIPPSERADFIAGWEIANAEYKTHGTSGTSWGRQRMDEIAERYGSRELGFYH